MIIKDKSVNEKNSINKFIKRNKECMSNCIVLYNPPFIISRENSYKDIIVTLDIEVMVK